MNLIKLFIFIFTILFCINTSAQKIAIIDIESLIDKNQKFKEAIKNIEKNQEKDLKFFENTENDLEIMLKDIEDSKLLLNDPEINNKINNYNIKLDTFKRLVDEYNLHYQKQVIKIKEKIISEIMKLLENYITDNEIDLILDSTNYLISSNSLDITEIIRQKLDKLNIKLEYEYFKKD